jgi:hypothetical protein
MNTNPWTIPFDNITHVCWHDTNTCSNEFRQMTEHEERVYFTAENKEKYLNELLNK